ncbi:hypothetical protein BKA66DRAFT_555351 [Pyrenochaeta sp. MPI-SDFR-AT-0127]|nr:hypothetical protein BKA66DRAFT_555351 [Pyrenochaeta sp. MPI-SDFR-AT-0127]
MKRKNSNNLTGARKKPRVHLNEADSVYDQAKPYRLVTAKFPIDALTPEWSIGTNRPINEPHKRRLLQIFKESGVLRRDAEHRLQVACTKAQVQQMLNYLEQEGSQTQSAVGVSQSARQADVEFLSFENWSSVVGGKAELMAGNHRVEALKEYLRYSQSSEAERWWVCDIYDRDELPSHLHIKLRANREDTILPDNHGQIWTELATFSSNDEELFQGSNKEIENKMLKWCQFPIGQATFNISTFEWMASRRIDDFWFAAFDQVIEVVSQIRSQFSFDVQLTDWKKLAGLPQTHSREDVQGLFFPDVESNDEPCPSSTRPRDFLSNISDDIYHSLYQFILSEPTRRFVDIQALLRTTKQDGKLMSIAMSHVSQWMNHSPTKVGDRDNNKPALRNDLIPALEKKYGEDAERKSIALQEQLLRYVQNNTKEFTNTTIDHYLQEYPGEHSNDYIKRFEHVVWRDLLSIVLDFAGPNLQHECMLRFNAEDTRDINSKPSSTITQATCDLICSIPEVAKNPALQSTIAADKLYAIMQPIILRWAVEQCDEALERCRKVWKPSMVTLVDAERKKFETLLEDLRLPDPSVSPPAASGIDVNEPRRSSRTHGSVEEHGPVKSNMCGPTSRLNSRTQPQTAQQLHDLAEVTTGTLKERRKLHRTKQRAPQNTQPHNLPESSKQTRHVITGPRHWRQRVPAAQSRP